MFHTCYDYNLYYVVDEWKEEGKGGFEGNKEIDGGERRLKG